MIGIEVIFKLAAIGVLITIVCQILKKTGNDDIATLVGLVGLIIALTFVVGLIGEFFQSIKDIFDLF